MEEFNKREVFDVSENVRCSSIGSMLGETTVTYRISLLDDTKHPLDDVTEARMTSVV
jgi:hypothetical protein